MFLLDMKMENENFFYLNLQFSHRSYNIGLTFRL